jgi:hypothetical protein
MTGYHPRYVTVRYVPNDLSPKALDLDEVTGYFSRTVAELDSAGEKLDDRMQPLLDSQCGAVVKSTDRK